MSVLSVVHGRSEVLEEAAPPALDLWFEDAGACVVVLVRGRLDVYTAPDFRKALDAGGLGGREVVIDLTGVHFLDSAGLGALASIGNALLRDGWRLGVAGEGFARLARIAGLAGAFVTGPTVASVVHQISPRAAPAPP